MSKKRKKLHLVFFLFLLFILTDICCAKNEEKFCDADIKKECNSNTVKTLSRYLLYDVNPPEGFNLRRDVYVRMAVFAHDFKNNKKLKNFKLVLPPWTRLYHWHNDDRTKHRPWSHFFDIISLQKFAPVIEMHQFFDEVGVRYQKVKIDDVFVLQHFEDMFEMANFEEKMAVGKCNRVNDVKYFYYKNITSDNVKCVSFHGHTSQLASLLIDSKARIILLDHAEIPLHDHYGSQVYWQARRSMRFSKDLRAIADMYREIHLNSTDKNDNTYLPDDWTEEKGHRNAIGGSYLAVHLRRRDFLWGRPTQMPSIDNAAKQIKRIMAEHTLKHVFIATDAPDIEFQHLRQLIERKKDNVVYRFMASAAVQDKYGDGGVAIVDQIICSHASFFVGTHESTFSFRIQEEREILGFPVDTSFNTLCSEVGGGQQCNRPSQWLIVY